ncbi:MAG: CubicO group peptidase (beta-lactamase class C family) [Flavobacterium sp.]|jgi:CubicO group peptidase (beta-lactamase class C family)
MKKILKFSFFILLIALLILTFINYPKLDLITGFSAKSVASATFIDSRKLEIIESEDNNIDLVKLATNSVNVSNGFAFSTIYGLKERKAIYRKGLGALLLNDGFDESKPYLSPKRNIKKIEIPYPYGNLDPIDTVFKSINYSKLKTAVTNAFDKKGVQDKRTRSIVVLYKGKLIAEHYADNFTKNSKILGWSMTKSIAATYFGILEKQGILNINDKTDIAEWQKDERKNITYSDLLQMNSGLEWEEKYDKICDATKMLFQANDMGKVQMDKPLAFKTNEHWNYSSGTTNLLSKILRSKFKSHQEYLDFWYSALIDKIGMHSMIVEADAVGNYVASSYAWATTRDWAKFGQLYLNKGKWNGEQLFDPSWANYVATETNTSKGEYGAHFWLNRDNKFPDAPKDLYYCGGFQGQKVIIIPSLDLVVVRMGTSETFDVNQFLKEIIGCFKN